MSVINPALAQLLQLKNHITFFKGLNENEISDLIFNIRFQKFKANELVFAQGDTKTKEIYYLITGSTDIFIFSEDENKDIYLSSIDKPTLFGEMRSFIDEPRSATIKAGNEGAVLITFLIKESKEYQSPIAFSKFYKNVIKTLSKKIMDMNKKI